MTAKYEAILPDQARWILDSVESAAGCSIEVRRGEIDADAGAFSVSARTTIQMGSRKRPEPSGKQGRRRKN